MWAVRVAVYRTHACMLRGAHELDLWPDLFIAGAPIQVVSHASMLLFPTHHPADLAEHDT